ncbi:hypothetical protein ACFL3C_05630 [Patescibacteria group bacterium]
MSKTPGETPGETPPEELQTLLEEASTEQQSAEEAPPYDGPDRRNVIVDPDGMREACANRILVDLGITWLRDPQELRPPDKSLFRKTNTDEFRASVHAEMIKKLERAKPHQVKLLEKTNIQVSTELDKHPTIKQLRDLLGFNVIKLGRTLEWYVGLCEKEIPSRVDTRYMVNVGEKALEVANALLLQVTDEEIAGEIEKGFRAVCNMEAINPKAWEELKHLEGPEFVQWLYKYLGVHIGFQGLRQDELGRLGFEDMKEVARYLLGFKEGQEESSEPKKPKTGIAGIWQKIANSPFLASKSDMRRLDTLEPALFITFDKGLFAGMSGEDQLLALKELNNAIKGENVDADDYLEPLGVVQAFDMAARASIITPKDEAKKVGSKVVRLALKSPQSPERDIFVDTGYNRSDGHKKRKLKRDKVDATSIGSGAGLACGKVFSLDA